MLWVYFSFSLKPQKCTLLKLPEIVKITGYVSLTAVSFPFADFPNCDGVEAAQYTICGQAHYLEKVCMPHLPPFPTWSQSPRSSGHCRSWEAGLSRCAVSRCQQQEGASVLAHPRSTHAQLMRRPQGPLGLRSSEESVPRTLSC